MNRDQRWITQAQTRGAESAYSPASLSHPPAAMPDYQRWLRSGKNLDLCLLAFCSCILTLLCHQSVFLTPSSSSSAPSSPPVTRLSDVAFVIKAGLFTSSHTSDETDPELEEVA